MLKSLDSVSFWFFGWAFFLALAWLLPNHDFPWTSFHSEAWAAVFVFLVFPVAIWVGPRRICIDYFLVAVIFSFIYIWAQFFWGKIEFFGNAWVGSLYLSGFFISIISGRLLESWRPGVLMDALFCALFLASLGSVFLQLHQWLDIDGLGVWLVSVGGSVYPSGNLGQKNQLASLLLLGCLAMLWGALKHRFSLLVVIPAVAVLLFGIALCRSRTAWLAIALIVSLAWFWRDLWTNKRTPWVFAGLGLLFCFMQAALLASQVSSSVLEGGRGDAVSSGLSLFSGFGFLQASADPRLDAWRMFLFAIAERPLGGYGWGQVAAAQILVSDSHPALNIVFSNSHNLFLDFIIWWGVPFGLFLVAVLAFWFFRQWRAVASQESVTLFLFFVVLLNHAMFEYPLHYFYFLLPFGLAVGVGSAHQLALSWPFFLGKKTLTAIAFVFLFAGYLTVIDYMRVEKAYRLLRMEWAGLFLEPDPKPPRVIVLTQWPHVFNFARGGGAAITTDEELNLLRNVLLLEHKPLYFMVFAKALCSMGRKGEAVLWIDRLCKVQDPYFCSSARLELERSLVCK